MWLSAAPSASVRSVVRWRSSLSNRAFSMAMTAWAAKFVTSSICLSVKGRTSWRYRMNAPISSVSLQHRDGQERPDAAKFDCRNDVSERFRSR